MKIALTYNLKSKDLSKPADYFSEFDSAETVSAIVSALESKGHSVDAIDVNEANIISYFKGRRVDMVFNIAEGKGGRLRESNIPAVLDYLNIPYTGSGPFSLGVAMNKALTKKILIAENIPTPRFQIFRKGNEKLNAGLKFPLIVKPNCEGSSKGINRNSVVDNIEALYDKIKETKISYNQDVIAEEFINGRELTVGVLKNGKIKALPILEIDFSPCATSGEFFYSWRMKEFQGDTNLGLAPRFHCPAVLDKETEERIKDIAIRTHRAIGCFDISRTDIRLSQDNVPYVLEINPLPGLDPRESNLPVMAYAAGMKYEDLIDEILMSALERSRLN